MKYELNAITLQYGISINIADWCILNNKPPLVQHLMKIVEIIGNDVFVELDNTGDTKKFSMDSVMPVRLGIRNINTKDNTNIIFPPNQIFVDAWVNGNLTVSNQIIILDETKIKSFITIDEFTTAINNMYVTSKARKLIINFLMKIFKV